MKRATMAAATGLLIVAPIVYASTVIPLAPLIIKVSFWNIAVERVSGKSIQPC